MTQTGLFRRSSSAVRHPWQARLTRVLVLLLLAAALWVGYHAVQTVRYGRALMGHLTEAQSLASQDAAQMSLTQINALVQGAYADALAFQAAARPFLALAPYLGWLPKVGGDVQAAPLLVEAGVEAAAAVAIPLERLAPLGHTLERASSDPGARQQALLALAQARPDIEQARTHLQRALATRQGIDTQRLSPRVAKWVTRADAALQGLGLALDGSLILPELLGVNGPRYYLILTQNADEIRPTGGFISAAGLLSVEAGRITSLTFEDSYAIDDLQGHAYPDPPAPLLTYMRSELWLFRDSNWSPDFPTSARQAAEFYRMGRGVEVDGVIALDQRAVQLIVTALEPLPPLPGSSQPITGEMVIDLMRESRSADVPWWQRKDFIAQIAAALYTRIEQGLSRGDILSLAGALDTALRQRHVLIYLRDPQAHAMVAARHWDGALRPNDGDYLMVVDANLGFNKANALVEEAIQYNVNLSDPTRPQADVQITYHHHAQSQERPCVMRVPVLGSYAEMAAGCYWDYVRVLAPQGSRLLWATRHPLPAGQLISGQPASGEAETLAEPGGGGKTAFGKFLVVPSGERLDSGFSYMLPASVVQRDGDVMRYRLLVQKQPGPLAPALTITIQLRPGASIVAVEPAPTRLEGDRLRFELALETDQSIEVALR